MYQYSLDNPFVFDDRDTVLLNPSLIRAWDFRAVLFHSRSAPAVDLSYALDRGLWGFSSFGFHVTNVVLHILVVGLFFGWCTRALSDAVGRAHERRESAEWAAFLAAGVFAVHPAMSATAGYTSARPELLCAMGFLGALTFARRAILASSAAAGATAAAFGLLAAASSPSAVALPLVMLAYDAWVLRDDGWRRRARRVYLPAGVFAAVAAAWQISRTLAIEPPTPRGILPNLLTQAVVIWRYVGLLLTLQGQALVHQVHQASTVVDPEGLAALLALAGSVAVALHYRRVRPLVAFGVIWFLAVLAPSSSVIPFRDEMAEHRVYLASAGLFLAGASALAGLLTARRVARAVTACVLALLAFRTYERTREWSDPIALWQATVERSPGAWQAHLGYAHALREVHRCDRAIAEYEAALRLNPALADAVYGLAKCR